jgi:hypothetical protein
LLPTGGSNAARLSSMKRQSPNESRGFMVGSVPQAGSGTSSLGRLARRQARDHGRRLEAGDHIMTGSFTRQFLIAPGDRIRTEFDRLATVEASFV